MSDYVKLIDSQGREFSTDSGASFYLGDDVIDFFSTLNPGVTKKGKIVFDVQKTMTLVNVKVSSSMITNSFYTVSMWT